MRQRFKSKPLWICFVDFTKAFDYVNRSALYYKLIQRGVNGKILKLIADMYEKAKCRVKWKGIVGGEIESEYGVLQGGMMSPNLFTEFLHDLKDELDSQFGVLLGSEIMTYILYADDLILCSDSVQGMQKLLDGLYTYCGKWHMIVSLTKTNIMNFGGRKENCRFFFGTDEVQQVEEYKYLGTIISNNRNIFKKNTDYLQEKAQNAIFSLKAYVKSTVSHLQPSLAMKMFDAQISPILEYNSEIWCSDSKAKSLEQIHLAYIKDFLKIKSSSSTLALYSELGRFPIKLKMQIQLIKYWQRILGYDEDNILKQSYNSLLECHYLGQINWCTEVKNILRNVEMERLWEAQSITNIDITKIKESIYSKFMQETMTAINDSTQNPKLRTFKTFKEHYKLEQYLCRPDNLNHTLALLRFRISSHNLRIETGRYTRPITPADQRLCNYCTAQEVEDEMHFLLDCAFYIPERVALLNAVKPHIPNYDDLSLNSKFTAIMSNKETRVTRALGKYVYKCLENRNNHVIEHSQTTRN